MAFTPKDWKDAPDHSTPLSAAALEDLEARVTAYADSVSGGSGPREIVVPFAWDDADIGAPGKLIYTPEPGDRLLLDSFVSVSTSFNGTSPFLYLYLQGNSPSSGIFTSAIPAADDTSSYPGIGYVYNGTFQSATGGGAFYFVAATPLLLRLGQGFSSNPPPIDSTQGQGEVRLLVMPKGGPQT